jgi:hypothetical protein
VVRVLSLLSYSVLHVARAPSIAELMYLVRVAEMVEVCVVWGLGVDVS